VSEDWPPHVLDPAGRKVVFDGGTHLHMLDRSRDRLLDEIDVILGAVKDPTFREDDPIAGRERFYCYDFPADGSWLQVVVDFDENPARVVTAFVISNDPRLRQR
jgi:hypothetical protein